MTAIQEFDYNIDVKQFIFWQYDNSNVGNLTTQHSEFLEVFQNQFWEDWSIDVFNLATANDFGLSVWAIILDLPLVFEPSVTFTIGWGFGPGRKNFSNGNFTPASSALSRLTPEQRKIILQYQ